MCSTTSALKFIKIVGPYVEQVPEMLYKISYSLEGRKKRPVELSSSKWETSTFVEEDMVWTALRNAEAVKTASSN